MKRFFGRLRVMFGAAVLAVPLLVAAQPAQSPPVRPVANVNISPGEAPFFRYKTFDLSDRSELKVNDGNGNLLYKHHDLAISGGAAGMGLDFTRYYNSGDSFTWEDLGKHWRLGLGEDVKLMWAQAGSNAVTFVMPSGTWVRFTRPSAADPFTAEPGFGELSLTNPVTGTWNLTDRSVGTTAVFQDTPDGSRVLLQKIVDRHNNAITLTYGYVDRYGLTHPSAVSDALGRSVTITRDSATDLVTQLADWTGRTVQYGYDASNRLISATDPAGGVTRYGYDGSGALVSVTDPNNNTTLLVYGSPDFTSPVFSLTRPDGSRWTFKYDRPVSWCDLSTIPGAPPISSAAVGAAIAQDPRSPDPFSSPTDQDSMLWKGSYYCFDAQGRVLRTKQTDRGSYDYVYDANGYESGVGWGSTMNTTVRDSSSRLLSTQAVTGATTSFGYADPANPDLPTSVTNTEGYTSTLGYDAAGDPTTITDAAANTKSYAYNADGTVASATDQRGNVTSYGYAGGDLTSVAPPGTALGTTMMTYDALSRPVSVTDGKGQTTTMSYDALDRPVKVTHSDGTFVSNDYDGDGNTTRTQEGNGTTVTATTSYAYDSRNHVCWELAEATTETACTVAGPPDTTGVDGGVSGWDPGGGASGPPAGATSYGYDSLGKLVSYTDAGGTVGYAYGVGGRLTQVTEPDGRATTFGIIDKSGQFPTHPAVPPTVSYPNGVTVTNTSDNSNRLLRTRATSQAGVVLMDLSYDYRNPASPTVDRNLIYTKTDNLTGNPTTYTYDPVGRLTSAVEETRVDEVSFEVVASWSYTYDAAGNRTSKTENGVTTNYTYDAADELTAADTTSYGHDGNGNLTSSSTGFAASYNAKNQTATITPAGGSAVSATYSGEGQGKLTTLGSNTYTNGGLGLASENGAYITRHSDGGLISVRNGGNTYYLLQDQLGSVVAVTDANGNQAAGFSYDPFGQTTSATGNPGLSPFRFAGELYSTATGLSKMGERFYDPNLGRWTQQDPLGAGNAYAYADNNPVNYTDPSGLSPHGAVCRFLVGAAGGFYPGLIAGKHSSRIIPKIKVPGIGDLYIDEFARYGIPGALVAALVGLSNLAGTLCGDPPAGGGGDDKDGPPAVPGSPEPAPAPDWPDWKWPAIIGGGALIIGGIIGGILGGGGAGEPPPAICG